MLAFFGEREPRLVQYICVCVYSIILTTLLVVYNHLTRLGSFHFIVQMRNYFIFNHHILSRAPDRFLYFLFINEVLSAVYQTSVRLTLL